ncbi:trimethylamine-N-oxide reductase 1 [Salmonella enterica subsp. diarizonae]|uniref:Trimethylamine-N-oxide reductase 1 n=1 Tax=Salmonella diarizonae TaxID=59204 RepID=A0A379TX23_SALDZ|nr:trimethylamine-N-oxide reductase 1 [Salmonella enterica subsp. diarizonae]
MGGWCVQRMHHGEQYPWMLVVLASMVGQIGLPGGGVGFGWHYNGGGTVTSAGRCCPGLAVLLIRQRQNISRIFAARQNIFPLRELSIVCWRRVKNRL